MTEQRESRIADQRKPQAAARGPSEEELVARFRMEMFSNALPDIPPSDGWHFCWLSTTNKYDSITSREARGYVRVHPDEVPGMEHIVVKEGRFAGCIGHEEMILYKLPTSLWQKYMEVAHHERPYNEEERVRDVARYVKDMAQDGGGDVYLGDGTKELLNARRPRTPTFTE